MNKLMSLCVLSVLASPVLADECALVIEGNDAMQFNLKEMSVPASCKEVTVTLNHTGKLPVNIMGHNWVLAATPDVQAVVNDGLNSDVEQGYLPKEDKRVLAHTKLIGGGESSSVTFKTDGLAGQDLTFFCSFPGHVALMKGSFKIS